MNLLNKKKSKSHRYNVIKDYLTKLPIKLSDGMKKFQLKNKANSRKTKNFLL